MSHCLLSKYKPYLTHNAYVDEHDKRNDSHRLLFLIHTLPNTLHNRYFDDDEPNVSNNQNEYLPSANSPTHAKDNDSGDESDDPLDSFMAGIAVSSVLDSLFNFLFRY